MAVEQIKKAFAKGSIEEKQFLQEMTEKYTQVHLDLARVLEEVMKDRKHSDTWLDVADKLVIGLSGHVVFMAKKDHNDMVTELRALTAKP